MKDGNGKTGGKRATCQFYEEIDAIVGTRAGSRPPLVLDSGGGVSVAVVDNDEGKTSDAV